MPTKKKKERKSSEKPNISKPFMWEPYTLQVTPLWKHTSRNSHYCVATFIEIGKFPRALRLIWALSVFVVQVAKMLPR